MSETVLGEVVDLRRVADRLEAGTRTAFRGCSMLTTPLVDDDVTLGLLVVLCGAGRGFSPPRRRRMERVAGGVALTLRDALRRAAETAAPEPVRSHPGSFAREP